MKRSKSIATLVATMAVAVSMSFGATNANAQDLFSALFGDGPSGGASGKQHVSFSKKFSRNTVVVSFGDRRL